MVNNVYSFGVTCAKCGGEITELANAAVNETETKAVVKCSECSKQWMIWVRLVPISNENEAKRRAQYR